MSLAGTIGRVDEARRRWVSCIHAACPLTPPGEARQAASVLLATFLGMRFLDLSGDEGLLEPVLDPGRTLRRAVAETGVPLPSPLDALLHTAVARTSTQDAWFDSVSAPWADLWDALAVAHLTDQSGHTIAPLSSRDAVTWIDARRRQARWALDGLTDAQLLRSTAPLRILDARCGDGVALRTLAAGLMDRYQTLAQARPQGGIEPASWSLGALFGIDSGALRVWLTRFSLTCLGARALRPVHRPGQQVLGLTRNRLGPLVADRMVCGRVDPFIPLDEPPRLLERVQTFHEAPGRSASPLEWRVELLPRRSWSAWFPTPWADLEGRWNRRGGFDLLLDHPPVSAPGTPLDRPLELIWPSDDGDTPSPVSPVSSEAPSSPLRPRGRLVMLSDPSLCRGEASVRWRRHMLRAWTLIGVRRAVVRGPASPRLPLDALWCFERRTPAPSSTAELGPWMEGSVTAPVRIAQSVLGRLPRAPLWPELGRAQSVGLLTSSSEIRLGQAGQIGRFRPSTPPDPAAIPLTGPWFLLPWRRRVAPPRGWVGRSRRLHPPVELPSPLVQRWTEERVWARALHTLQGAGRGSPPVPWLLAHCPVPSTIADDSIAVDSPVDAGSGVLPVVDGDQSA